MSFRGKVVKSEKVMTPLGPGELVTTEYNQFPRRSKVIWWMGEGKIIELGELITVFTVALGRKDDFEPITWEPLCYEVKLLEEADTDAAIEQFFSLDEVSPGEAFEFDDKEKAEEFIELLKCKSVKSGGIEIDNRAEFKRWKEAVERVKGGNY